nr:MAG TPA: hypothetical protein [Caudoviricetes sp.]
MVLNVEGSSPFSHPIKRGISVIIFLFFYYIPPLPGLRVQFEKGST